MMPDNSPETCQLIQFESLSGVSRNSLGGQPYLPLSQDWPQCEHCQAQLTFYLQLEIQPQFGLPFEAGSQLLIFACLKHGDPVTPPLLPELSGQLPESYGEILPADRAYSQFRLLLNRPGSEQAYRPAPAGVEPQQLHFETLPENLTVTGLGVIGRQGLKLGGVPSWCQDPESYRCSCGAEMAFLLQIPQDFEFARQQAAPEQEIAYGAEYYLLFLGNEIYLQACTAQCRPDALWPVAQN